MSGSSIGSIIGGVIGVVLAPFTGGASLAVTGLLMAAGGMIGGMLDPQKLPPQTGPKLSDLSQQTATYGAFIPRVYGTVAVFGNVFWVENNKLKEVATTEVVGGKGSAPEGSSTTYKYYATFALGLCEGPIFGIKRIWIGGKLWYNVGTTDADTLILSSTKEKLFKLYLGTETQMPNARMQADIGIANCPAYRGLAYLVIEDFELTLYGNSMAGVQIKVEVIKSDAAYTNENNYVGSISGLLAATDMALKNKIVYTNDTNTNKLFYYNIADPANPVLLGFVPSVIDRPRKIVVFENSLWVMSSNSTGIALFDISFGPPRYVLTVVLAGGFAGNAITISNGAAYIASSNLHIYTDSKIGHWVTSINTSSACYAVAASGNFLYFSTHTPDVLYVYDITDLSSPVLMGSVSLPIWATNIVINDNKAFVSAATNGIYIYDVSVPSTPTLLGNTGLGGGRFDISGNNIYAPNPSSGQTEIRILDKTNITAITSTKTITGSAANASSLILTEGYAVVLTGTSISLYFYLSHISASMPTLSSIVQSECLQTKLLSATDIDVTQLTQLVRGYRVSSQSAIRGSIESLQGGWPFDVIQDGYKIKYVSRGNAPVLALTHDKLDARGFGQGSNVRITQIREMDSVLPVKVMIIHMDFSREYDNGEQYYERTNTDATNSLSLELPIVFTAAEAAGKAQTLCFLYWLERYDISFTLPPEYNQLQPADVITLTTPGANYNLRIKQINYTQDGRLEITAKYNQPSIYTPTTVLGSEGIPGVETLPYPGISIFVPLDIPLLSEANNTFGFPAAMSSNSSNWGGAVLSRSDDGGKTYGLVNAFTPPRSIVGSAINTLSAHPGTLIDKASILNLRLVSGTLASVTETQMLNGSNHFAYGSDGKWEIIAAQNCVLQGDGSYNLTDLLRGRFGTEQYTSVHSIGDYVVLLNSTVPFMKMASAQIGASRDYVTLTSGASSDRSIKNKFTYNGVNLKPLSPIYLNGNRNPTSNDWTLTWIRRSRIDEGWWPLLNSQVGETTESYIIEIYSEPAFVTLKRTLTSATQSVVYSSASQVTDFGFNQTTLFLKIYQVSAIVGNGYPLATTITR